VGTVGCAVLSGFVGGAVGGAVGYGQATHGTGAFSWGGLAQSALAGGAAGALTGGLFAGVGALLGSDAGSAIGSEAGDAVGDAAGDLAGSGAADAVATTASDVTANAARSATQDAAQGTETFYRTMSNEDFAQLQATGNVPATSETFISPSQAYAQGYDGTTVELTVQSGTHDALASIGVRDTSLLAAERYPDMPVVSSGWTQASAYFKNEGEDLINIGLGRGAALDMFNKALIGFRVVS